MGVPSPRIIRKPAQANLRLLEILARRQVDSLEDLLPN